MWQAEESMILEKFSCDFGYTPDLIVNGDMGVFTQGADRFFYPAPGGPANPAGSFIGYITERIAFSAADNYWESFQNRVNTFINSTLDGGTANVNEPVKVRPVVGDMIDELKPNDPIGINCN